MYLLRQNSRDRILEQFLSDNSIDKSDSDTGSTKGGFVSGVVQTCNQQGVNKENFARTILEKSPRNASEVVAVVSVEPQKFN